jgi:hypothetical protein
LFDFKVFMRKVGSISKHVLSLVEVRPGDGSEKGIIHYSSLQDASHLPRALRYRPYLNIFEIKDGLWPYSATGGIIKKSFLVLDCWGAMMEYSIQCFRTFTKPNPEGVLCL